MGEIRRPEDVINRRGRSSSDLGPQPMPRQGRRRQLDDVWRAIERLTTEIDKMKIALRAHGIIVE